MTHERSDRGTMDRARLTALDPFYAACARIVADIERVDVMLAKPILQNPRGGPSPHAVRSRILRQRLTLLAALDVAKEAMRQAAIRYDAERYDATDGNRLARLNAKVRGERIERAEEARESDEPGITARRGSIPWER